MKVSFIVPVYNCEKYLENCIQSICKIKSYDWELILVDDGSKDSSGEICDRYGKTNQNIKVFHQKNQGPSAARNKGIELATGEYIRFADSDDEVLPVDEIIHKDFDLGIYNAQLLNENLECIRTIQVGISGDRTEQELLEEMNESNKAAFLHYIWNKVYKTEIIKNNGIMFDESLSLGEDFSFNCKYLCYCKRIFLSAEVGYSYFYRCSDSLTQKFIDDELNRRRRLDNQLVQLYKNNNLYKEPYICKIKKFIGMTTINSLQNIEKPDCNLKFRDKWKYISSFISSEYREYLLAALCNNKKMKFGQKIQRFMIKLKWSFGLTVYYEVYNKIKGWKR
ncbi:MAG: glycosyltransferase [Clostridia bacterium]|nr:glycosyltransferase [Clostridia bacterium]